MLCGNYYQYYYDMPSCNKQQNIDSKSKHFNGSPFGMADQEDIGQRYRRTVTQYISGLKPLKPTPMGIMAAMQFTPSIGTLNIIEFLKIIKIVIIVNEFILLYRRLRM